MTTATATPDADHLDTSKRELCGTVRKLIFYDPDSGATIAAVAVNNNSPQAGEAICKGECEDGELEAGGAYRFFGRWQNHYKHGAQFLFQTFTTDTLHGRAGVVAYLAREAPHVGMATAAKLWRDYGSGAIETLRMHPEAVAAAGILSLDHAREASETLTKLAKFEKTKIDLFELFAGRGFTKRTIGGAIAKWGVKAAERVRRDPYLLMTSDIPGAGFKRCDRLFLDLRGNTPQAAGRLKRQMFAAWYALQTGGGSDGGDTWVNESACRRAIVGACGMRAARFDAAIRMGIRAGWLTERWDGVSNTTSTAVELPSIPCPRCDGTILWEKCCQDGCQRSVSGQRWIAEHAKAMNEATVAQHVKRLLAHRPVRWPAEDILADDALSSHQRITLAGILTSPLCILAGTPGTGKTYAAAVVLRHVLATYGESAIHVCAPTGKAAVRITEAMQRYKLPLEATTIHRALEIGRNGHDGKGWGFLRNERRPLDQRFICVDEASMLDTDLAASLFAACATGAHVLLIGDSGQLPPVGHGSPLRDLIAAFGGVPTGAAAP